MISQVEGLRKRLQPDSFGQEETAAEPCVQAEKIESVACVAIDENAVYGWARARALDRVRSCRDVEWQRRIILKHRCKLESVADMLPRGISPAGRGVDRSVEHQPVALIVIGSAVVLPNIELVDRAAEKEFAYVVERFRIRVRDPIIAPAHGPLHERNMQAVIVRIRERRILAVISVVRVRAASIIASRRCASRDVLVHGNDEMQSAHMLIADGQTAVGAKLPLDFKVPLLRVRILDVRIHRGEIEQHTGGQCQIAENIWKHRRADLSRRKADADLAELRGIRRIVCR